MEEKKVKRPKYEVVIVSVPAAGNANQLYMPDTPYKPDQAYKNVVGMWLKVLEDSDADYVLASLADQYKEYIDPIHSDLLHADNGVSPNDKFLKIRPIPCDGRIVMPGIQVPNSPAAQVDVMFVFMLSDELIQIADVNR